MKVEWLLGIGDYECVVWAVLVAMLIELVEGAIGIRDVKFRRRHVQSGDHRGYGSKRWHREALRLSKINHEAYLEH
jgi:hypothetical protein